MIVLIALISVLAVMTLVYYFVIRPWHLLWGATKDELLLSLPGDSLVADPDFNATRGISIDVITRLRTKYVWKGFWIIYYLLYDFGDIIMMTKCLKGIKERAEKLSIPQL